MASALGSWSRAALVLVTPLILFAAVAVAATLIVEASPSPGYFEAAAYLPLAICPNETSTPPFSQTWHGVTFNLTVIDECSPGGPWLEGTVAEANGTTFHLGIWSMRLGNQTWFSPDHRYCGVDWLGGINEDVVMLYVKS